MKLEIVEKIINGEKPIVDYVILMERHEIALSYIIKNLRPTYGLNNYSFSYHAGTLKEVTASLWESSDFYKEVVLFDGKKLYSIYYNPTEKEWSNILDSFDLFRLRSSPAEEDSFRLHIFENEYRAVNSVTTYFQEDEDCPKVSWRGVMESLNLRYAYFPSKDITVLCDSHQNVKPFSLVIKGDKRKDVSKAGCYNSNWFNAPGYSYNFEILNALEVSYANPKDWHNDLLAKKSN